MIDGSIGEGSAFHELFGYYAQDVGERAAVLPRGQHDRLAPISNPNTNGITELCLEVHDLAISKHVASREKDIEFARELAKHDLTSSKILFERLNETELSPELRKIAEERIRRDAQHEKAT